MELWPFVHVFGSKEINESALAYLASFLGPEGVAMFGAESLKISQLGGLGFRVVEDFVDGCVGIDEA